MRIYYIALLLGSPFFALLLIDSGALDGFFYGAKYASVKGIDFFSLPKAYLNLLKGVSPYATWDPPMYGPVSTWYLAHPAFAIFLGPFVAFFAPATSYKLFTIISCWILCASVFAFNCLKIGGRQKILISIILLLSFPIYWILYVGNIHAITVLSLSLILVAMLKFIEKSENADKFLFSGLILSLFSKPVVFLFLVPLFCFDKTRRTTLYALAIYLIVSTLFILIPQLNPESVSLAESLQSYLSNPDLFNIFANNFRLNKFMRCNSVHWFNLVSSSNVVLNHIDIFSSTTLFSKLTSSKLPGWSTKIPILICWIMSFFIMQIKSAAKRTELFLVTIMCLTVCFFLSYNIVWEYQYASLMPLTACLLILTTPGRDQLYIQGNTKGLLFLKVALFFSALISLPSAFFLVDPNYESSSSITLIEASRVVPSMLIYLSLITYTVLNLYREKNYD